MAGYTSDADLPHQRHYIYMTKKEGVQHVRDKVKTATQRLTNTHDSGKVDTMAEQRDLEVGITIKYNPKHLSRPYQYKLIFPEEMGKFFKDAGYTTASFLNYEGSSGDHPNAWDARVAAEMEAARVTKRYGKWLEGQENSETYRKTFPLN